MEYLDEIGRSLGTAFQIQDDLLDVIADPERFGKTCGGDISEGKKTFLMVTTLERCSPDEREWLLQKLENRPVNEADRNKVMEMYESLGVLDAAKELMSDYYARARTALNRFEDSQTKQDFLKLINYLQHRDS
jgi:geranylgeranyl diphosphate synthase type II